MNDVWSDGSAGERIEVENPANEQVIATVPLGSADDAAWALETAQKVQSEWEKVPAVQRGRIVRRLGELVLDRIDELGIIITSEQGKPFNQARVEDIATADFLFYAADNARRIDGDILVSDNSNEEIFIRRHPCGVVVGLTAWNYPPALVGRKLGPALVAGALLLGMVFNILNFENGRGVISLSAYWQMVIRGAFLFAVIVFQSRMAASSKSGAA